MKILIVLIKREGGVGRVMSGIILELEKRGHIVEIISREDDLKCFSTRQAFFKLRKEVDNIDYYILYVQDWSNALLLLFKKNHFVCFHGINPYLTGRILQYIIGKIKGRRLIAVGPLIKKLFSKSNLIYNAVDMNQFKNLNKERKYVGWINKVSEIITLDEVKEIAKSYKCELSIATSIPPEKMNEWYNTLKVFISKPVKIAGFNLCYLEAKSSGVPLILGNENGIGITKINKDWRKMTWKNHVDKLLIIFENG